MKKGWYRGSITVFLSLTAVLFLSLICTVLESIRIEGAKVRGAACMDLGLFSVFGEYERDLFSEYHVLFFDGSYGTGNLLEEKMEARLKFFMDQNADMRDNGSEIDWFRVENIQTDIKKYFLATDEGGKAFLNQALLFMEGVEKTERRDSVAQEARQIKEKMQILNQKEKQLRNVWGEISKKEKEIFAFYPVEWLNNYEEKNVSDQVIPSSFSVSEREISGLEKVSERSRNNGEMEIPERGKKEEEIFKEYLFLTFGNALEQEERKALLYETEYFLAGYKSDRQNLESVCKELLKVRWADNFFCILQDEKRRKEVGKMIRDRRKEKEAEKKKEEKKEKKIEIEREKEIQRDREEQEKIDEITEEMILLTWAYQESLNDIKKLLSGGCVPFQKKSQEWEGQSVEFWKTDSEVKVQNTDDGWKYEDYLWLLFEINHVSDLPMKALDLIEWEMKNRPGTEFFCADCCVGGMATEALWQIEPVFFRITSAFSGIRSQTVQYRTEGMFFYEMGE